MIPNYFPRWRRSGQNSALQLWHCTIHQQLFWLRKLLLVNSTINWLTIRAITEDGSIETVTPDHEDAPNFASLSAHLFCTVSSPFPDIHLSVGPPLRAVSTYDIADNEAGLKFLTKTFPASKKKWRKSLKQKLHQFVKKRLKTSKGEISSKMTI